jgi:hypothetical protein
MQRDALDRPFISPEELAEFLGEDLGSVMARIESKQIMAISVHGRLRVSSMNALRLKMDAEGLAEPRFATVWEHAEYSYDQALAAFVQRTGLTPESWLAECDDCGELGEEMLARWLVKGESQETMRTSTAHRGELLNPQQVAATAMRLGSSPPSWMNDVTAAWLLQRCQSALAHVPFGA